MSNSGPNGLDAPDVFLFKKNIDNENGISFPRPVAVNLGKMDKRR